MKNLKLYKDFKLSESSSVIDNPYMLKRVKTLVSDSRASSRGKMRVATPAETISMLTNQDDIEDDDLFFDEDGEYCYIEDLEGKDVMYKGKKYSIESTKK